jgi:hypothetical protein
VKDVQESSSDLDVKVKRRAGTNVLADAVKLDKCPPPLVGCSASELFKATGGELTCPDQSMAPEPLVIDGKGRVCYAEQDILNQWMEVGPNGEKRFKPISIESLMNKYSKQLLEKFLDPNNKKLLIAASQAARNGFNIPPIILNFYKYNPFLMGFTENSSKHESRVGAQKHFRGLKQFNRENNYAQYQTKEIFATILSNFTNSLDIDTGAEFLTVIMTPLIRTPDTIRGIFDIHCPKRDVNLDFLKIGAYERSGGNGVGDVIHAVHANVSELIFTGVAAMSRDSHRIEKLQKLINSLGEMLKFGELAPEYENPENMCRQAGVAANNAISFLPIVLKNWLSNLPSTWRRPGPALHADMPDMEQRRAGVKPIAHGPGCGVAIVPGGGGGAAAGGGLPGPSASSSSSSGGSLRPSSDGAFGPGFGLRGGPIGFGISGAAEPPTLEERLGILKQSALNAVGKPREPVDLEARAAQSRIATAARREAFIAAKEARAAEAAAAVEAGRAARAAERGGGLSSVLAARSGGVEEVEKEELPQFGAGEDLEGGEELEGGGPVAYTSKHTVNPGGAVANPSTVEDVTGVNIVDPRMVLQNFISLCFYLNWVETFAHGSSDDSIISLFKSLRVSYEAAMAARSNVEELLKVKAEEEAKRRDIYKSVVTDKMVDEALNAKRGADASYLSTNVRIAKKLAKLLDIGWEKCKSNIDLQGESTDLMQNSWHDKMLPHQNLKKNREADPISLANLRFTVNQMPGLGHNDLVPNPPGPLLDGAGTNYPDYPDGQGDTWRSTLIYQNMGDSLSLTGVNTREFRRAWKNTCIAFDGVSKKKNHVARVGYMQLMSRIMDLHLTFAQSCESGRQYFLKMHEYSLMQSKRSGIPEDPRADVLLFNDPGHAISIYKQFSQTSRDLLVPLPSINVCKVVVGESQYFVFKSSHQHWTDADKAMLRVRASERMKQMYQSFRSTPNNPDWYRDILTLGNGAAAAGGALAVLSDAQKLELAEYIIESSVDFDAVNPMAGGRPGQTVLKMFGACEPLDTSDYYMFNRRKKNLDVDRAEDELFLLGIEGIAKYLDQTVLFASPVDQNVARRVQVGAAGARNPELLPIRDSPQDVMRRKSHIEGLNADERDWYARYIIFMTKVSGGNPARLAQYLLEVQGADNIEPVGALAVEPGAFQNKATPVQGRTKREAIAMCLVWLVRNPAPLFASMGTLQGGEEETPMLKGGEAPAAETPAQVVEAVDSVEADVDYLLTGGLNNSNLKGGIVQFDAPKHIREATIAARDNLTYQERELDMKLQKLGRRPIVHYEVGEKCPVSLTKYNNLFGKNGSSEWVETSHPWTKCQEKMGFQFKTRNGYCYPAEDKCYDTVDIKTRTINTVEMARNWKELAKLTNSLQQAEREAALQENRRQILSDEANNNISHSELEEMAHRMLPSSLRMLPDKVAVQAMVSLSEDVESQVHEMTDSSDEEQRRILNRLIREHRLLEEEWKDDNRELAAEYLNDLVKDLVENAKTCSNVSIAIKAQSSSAELRSNIRGALNYANTANTNTPSLRPDFVQSLPEDTQVLIRSSTLANRCDAQNLYEQDAVLMPQRIKLRVPEEGDNIKEIKEDGLINWWKKYHASTLERKQQKTNSLSKSLDPEGEITSQGSTDREQSLQKQLETALDRDGLRLLENAEGLRSKRHFRSKSRSRR